MKGNEEQAYQYTATIPEDYRPTMVRVDPNCVREERETIIVFSDGGEEAKVSSAQKTVIRYLLDHPCFHLEELTWLGGKIVGVSGRLSKNHFRITQKARRRFSSGFSRRGRKKKDA